MSEPSAAQAGQRTREELLEQAGAALLDVEGWVAPDRPGGQVRGAARYLRLSVILSDLAEVEVEPPAWGGTGTCRVAGADAPAGDRHVAVGAVHDEPVRRVARLLRLRPERGPGRHHLGGRDGPRRPAGCRRSARADPRDRRPAGISGACRPRPHPRVLSSGRRPRGASPRWPTNLPHRLERRR